jgi:hemolysin III
MSQDARAERGAGTDPDACGSHLRVDAQSAGRITRSMASEFRVRVFKDPVSSWTHFIGFWIALGAAVALVSRVTNDGTKLTGMAIYGATLVLLFGASSLYHWFDIGERGNRWLRRLDHAAIFLLIAGTYVPAILHLLDGTWRITMLVLVVTLAVAGALFKMVWIDCPDWLGLTLYLGLSFIVVVPAYKILPELSGSALAWLLAGGLAYTLGAVVYAREWPDPWPGRFGHHEIWHLFVLAGAAAHFVFTYGLVDRAYPPL